MNFFYLGKKYRKIRFTNTIKLKKMKENVITTTYTCVARQVPYVEQELLTLLGHLSSPAVFSGVLVAQT